MSSAERDTLALLIEDTGTKISGTDRDTLPNAGVFKPVLMLEPHDPVPMALVNRAPRGSE